MHTKPGIDTKVQFLHGFGHRTRVEILEQLQDGEKTVSEIMSSVRGSQSSISQHLACLRGCGLIVNRQEGKYVYYRLRNEKIHHLLNMFDDVLEDIQDDVDHCEHEFN